MEKGTGIIDWVVNTRKEGKRIAVVFRKGCLDGTMAAVMLESKYSYDDFDFFSFRKNGSMSDIIDFTPTSATHNVVILDICPLDLEAFLVKFPDLMLIDHHIDTLDLMMKAKNACHINNRCVTEYLAGPANLIYNRLLSVICGFDTGKREGTVLPIATEMSRELKTKTSTLDAIVLARTWLTPSADMIQDYLSKGDAILSLPK